MLIHQRNFNHSPESLFFDITENATKKTAASKFYALLVLAKQEAVHLSQEEKFSVIYIKKGARFDNLLMWRKQSFWNSIVIEYEIPVKIDKGRGQAEFNVQTLVLWIKKTIFISISPFCNVFYHGIFLYVNCNHHVYVFVYHPCSQCIS